MTHLLEHYFQLGLRTSLDFGDLAHLLKLQSAMPRGTVQDHAHHLLGHIPSASSDWLSCSIRSIKSSRKPPKSPSRKTTISFCAAHTPSSMEATLQRALNLSDGRARQQRVVLDVHNRVTSIVISGDAEQLHQVFVNLLINAIEAMPDGGRLSVAVSTTACGKLARVEIRDTGTGIHEQVLPRR